jgi:RNA polymerase sigma-70 factor (ECF subfamily)
LQNYKDTEDLTQEVFITVFKSIHQFIGELKISTWIYKIAVVKSLEYIWMKKHEKQFVFFNQS